MGIQRRLEARNFGFDLALGIGEPLAQDFQALLRARDVLGLVAHTRGRARRGTDSPDIRGGDRLAAEQGAQDGAADAHGGLHLLLRELRLLARTALLGTAHLVLQLD